jgi:hypothetical protein
MSKQTEALERAKFEEWYEADAMPGEADWFTRETDDPTEYKHIPTHFAWKGWLARALSEEAQPEPVASLRVMEESDPTWRGRSFIGLTDAGRALPAGDYRLYAQPVPALPEGWVAVPREPTDAMLDAAERTEIIHNEWGEDMYVENSDEVYRAMIAAAPPIAASEEKTE